MRLFIALIRRYPLQSLVMLLALLLAGIVEGFGLTALLPLVSTAVSSAGGGQSAASGTGLEQTVTEALSALGLSPTIGVLLLVLVLAMVVKSILVLLAKKRVGYTVAHVATDLRLELLRALLVARWEYFLRQPVGAIANAMATETDRTSHGYLRGAQMASYFFQAVVYTGVALLVSWKVTLVSLTAGLILALTLKRLIRKARHAGMRQTDLQKSLLAHLTDTVLSIKPLKAMAREEMADSVLEKKTTRLNKALEKQVFSKELLRAVQEPILTALLAIGLYVLLVYLHLPVSTTMVLVYLLARTVKQMYKVQQHYQEMVIFESAYWSLQKTIQGAEEAHESALGSQAPTLDRAIHLDRISFDYGDAQVLKNISLTFPTGVFTAIVGPSGAGKTTIVDLITALLRPKQGEIWIDDLPLAQIDVKSWRRMIGYVPQDTILLHDTILTNVTLGDPELNEEEAEYALRAAGAWNFVTAMPQGMQSTVGERGGMLSGGERQRIAIARALVHKPKLLILDEPTSALDPDSEAAICATLGKLSGEFTVLAISHQPALMKCADRAYRLKDGRATLVVDGSEASLGTEDGVIGADFVLDAASGSKTES